MNVTIMDTGECRSIYKQATDTTTAKSMPVNN